MFSRTNLTIRMISAPWQQLLHRLARRQAASGRRAGFLHRHLAAEDGAPPPEERPRGCGWFDSSHDLLQGLQVREADRSVLALLPLADWLVLQETPCYEADTPLDAAAGMIAGPTLH